MHKVNLAPMRSDVYTHTHKCTHILVSVDILSCRISSSFVLPFQHHDKTVSALHTLHLHQGETRLLVISERWGRGHDQPNPYGSCSTYFLGAIFAFLSQSWKWNNTLLEKRKGSTLELSIFFHQFSIYILFFFVISFFLFIFRSSGWSLDLKNPPKREAIIRMSGAPSRLSWNGSFVGSRLATEHFSLRPHTFVPWDRFRGGVWGGLEKPFFAWLTSSSSSSSCQIHWLNPSQ